MTTKPLFGIVLLACSSLLCAQENPTADEIVRGLKPVPRERGIQFVDPSEPAAPEELPKVSLTVNFRLNSAEVEPSGMQTVETLAKALGSAELADFRFEIAGHTDASGTRAYNLSLSQQRADRVRQLLVEKFGLQAAVLEAKGYGPDQLADPARPRGGKNRRVEIVNLGRKS